jgi:hypothetical protein
VANVGSPASALESGEVQAAARALGLEVTTVEIRRAEDITPAFEAIEGRADALYVPTEALVLTNRVTGPPPENTSNLADFQSRHGEARLHRRHAIASESAWSSFSGRIARYHDR